MNQELRRVEAVIGFEPKNERPAASTSFFSSELKSQRLQSYNDLDFDTEERTRHGFFFRAGVC